MKVTRFHHVSVPTGAIPLERVVAFYREVLGLADAVRPEIPGVDGHWFTVGDLQLHLVSLPGAADRTPGPGDTDPTRPIDPSGPHFCVAVADLDAAVAELDSRGIAHVRGLQGPDDPDRPGTVQIWINDPAGNTIELQQETR